MVWSLHLRFLDLNISPVGLTGKKEGKTRLMNMVMQVRLIDGVRQTCPTKYQLRKVTCHPYLFDGAVSLLYPMTREYIQPRWRD